MDITAIKQQLTLTEVLDRYGLRPDKQDRLLCPFHNDKTPSLQLYPKTGTWTCFSSNCDAGSGDVIDLIMRYEKITKYEAILRAKGMTEGENTTQYSRIAVLTKVFNTWKGRLNAAKTAKYYLQQRGIHNPVLDLGYNLGKYHQGAGKHYLGSLIKYGLLKRSPSNGYQAFAKNCIIFPLKNKQGQIVSIYGRYVTPQRQTGNGIIGSEGSGKHYYLTNRQGLYPNHPSEGTTQLILTESIIDAASLMVAGHMNVLALYGTNGLTDEHTEAIGLLKKLEEIVLFFDGDEAGRKAVQKHADTIHQLRPNIKISYVDTPENEDINSLLQGHEKHLFTHLLAKRTFLFSTGSRAGTGNNTEEENNTPSEGPRPITSLNTENPNRLEYTTDTARYYVLGGLRNELDSMKITLMISHPENGYRSRNKVDLYEDKQVTKLSREVGEKLDLRADLIEQDIYRLTDELDEHRVQKAGTTSDNKKEKKLIAPLQKQKCIRFLKQADLLEKIGALIGRSGVIGEENSRMFLFVIASSYKMAETLHALIQGSSGSGKTHLLLKISTLMPPEDTMTLTRVTDNSFYNYGEYDLKNKLICLEDLDGLKEEAQLAFRELQSRGQLASSTSIKDENGQIRGVTKVVRGPIGSMCCTTRGEVYEDNMSRCFLVAVDESEQQTHRIIAHQNRSASGGINKKEQQEAEELIRDCIRLLKRYDVINPYAAKIQLPKEAHKIRRLNELFQCFVRQVTLLNQYQRKRDEHGRLITELKDIEVAVTIMFDSIILKIDELDGSLRDFYENLKTHIKQKGENYEFGQREVRHAFRLSKSQLQRYMNDLLELEYIYQSSGFANRGYKYKIAWWDDMQALRNKVKTDLSTQLETLATQGVGSPNGSLQPA